MFPNTRLGRIALAFGTLIFVLAFALPPVSFRITDFGVAHHGKDVALVNDGTRHIVSGTALHFSGCKFVGQTGICVQKEIRYDRAHGLRLNADLSLRAPSEI